MKQLSFFNLLAAALAAFCVSTAAGETPRIGSRRLGPMVDVTLKTGESTKGELISFSDGNLKVKLDNGSIVTQDGSAVVSVRFIGDKPAPVILNAQATELGIAETERLINYRRRENGLRNPLADKAPAVPLTKAEIADYDKLRAQIDLHNKALEAEIIAVASEEAAQAKLNELGRYYFLYGQWGMNEIRILLKKAASSIRNPAVKAKFDEQGFMQFWVSFNEKHENRLKKMHEKALEKNMLDKIDKATPPATEKPAPPKSPGAAVKNAP